MIQHRAYSILNVKAIDAGTERVIEGIASTPTPDRVDDIVEPMGAQYTVPMPLLWQHSSDQPVGHVDFARPTKDGIPFRAHIKKSEGVQSAKLRERFDEAWESVKLGLVRGVSIGFKILDHDVMKNGGYRIKKWLWLELSLVTIPANQDATIQTIKSLDAKTLAAIGNGRAVSSSPGVPGQRKSQPQGTGTMTISEQIAARAEDLAAFAQRMETLLAKEETGLDKDEQDEIVTLENDIKETTAKLRRLKSLETAMATAKPVDGDEPVKATASRSGQVLHVYPEPKVKEEPGIGLARWAIHLARCGGDRDRTIKEVRRYYPNSPSIQIALKTDVPAADTRDAQYASPLVVPNVLGSEFVEFLRPKTIVGQFGLGPVPALHRIPFNIRVPAQTSAGTGYWVGEGAAKGVTATTYTYVEHRWYKVANIAVMTEEIMRFSNPSIEVLVRDELARALIERMDIDFITPSVTLTAGVRPAAITNGANTAAASGATAADVAADIGVLTDFLEAANISMNSLVLVMRNRQAGHLSRMKTTLGVFDFPTMTTTGGTLFGIPVITSNNVPSGVVVLLNTEDVYISDDGGVNVAMSNQASLEMETAPTMSANTGASPSTISAQAVVSMFQTNSVAIRAERFINWSRRHDAAVAYLTATGWGNTASSPDGAPL